MMVRAVRLLLIIVLGASITIVPSEIYAQKKKKNKKKEAKELKKKWKKKAKNYVKNPLALKAREEAYEKQIEELTNKNHELTEQVTYLQGEVDRLKSELSMAESRIKSCESEKERLKTAYEAQKKITTKDVTPGLVYKVQIGAFRYFDLSKYLQHTENFEGETQDGLNKYVIGKFRDYEMAVAFKKDIQRMGIKDAWVVPYIDGVRVTMEEARRYIQQQGGASTTTPPNLIIPGKTKPSTEESAEDTDF